MRIQQAARVIFILVGVSVGLRSLGTVATRLVQPPPGESIWTGVAIGAAILGVIGICLFMGIRLRRGQRMMPQLGLGNLLRRAPGTTSTGAVVRQYRMNYFDPGENSNKVWIGMAYSDGSFETQFGRVRDTVNLAVSRKKFATQYAAEGHLETKRNEKLRKGYKDTVVVDNNVVVTAKKKDKHNLSQLAAEQIDGAGDSVTAELIKYLAEVNIHHITHSTSIKYNAKTGAFSTPLGVLTPDAISAARDLLAELRRLDGLQRRQKKKRAECVREYFQLVPKDFGMKVPSADELIATEDQFQEEAAILDALESAIGGDPAAATHAKPKLFECKLVKIPHYTDEGRELFRKTRDLYFKTRNVQHHPGAAGLQMTRLYEVEIGEMKRRFDATAQKLGNTRDDLWHGTRASNLLSILRAGLVIPPSNAAHCTGRMFGNGIYTSLQSTKALNYATDFWNRSGGAGQRTFMFLCEVSLGKMHKPKGYGGAFPARGTDSTWVEPGKTGVMNHECIVYDTSQINLKYLAEFGKK